MYGTNGFKWEYLNQQLECVELLVQTDNNDNIKAPNKA